MSLPQSPDPEPLLNSAFQSPKNDRTRSDKPWMPGFRDKPRTFFSVAEVAHLMGMSPMTVYRAIEAGEFPAVRIRGRLIIPARAIEEMVDAALANGGEINAADWVPDEQQRGA